VNLENNFFFQHRWINTQKIGFFYQVFRVISGRFADQKNLVPETGKISYGRDFSAP
jgi:hypothetical protein